MEDENRSLEEVFASKASLLDALVFENWDQAQAFAWSHYCCWCRRMLNPAWLDPKNFIKDPRAGAFCPEHGIMYPHTVITERAADQANATIYNGKFLLYVPERERSEKEILHELGFE